MQDNVIENTVSHWLLFSARAKFVGPYRECLTINYLYAAPITLQEGVCDTLNSDGSLKCNIEGVG